MIVPKGNQSEDDLLEVVLDAGAEEINDIGDAFEIVSEPGDFVAVRTALQGAGIRSDAGLLEVRLAEARVGRERPQTAILQPPIEFECHLQIGSLGHAVRLPGVVTAVHERVR